MQNLPEPPRPELVNRIVYVWKHVLDHWEVFRRKRLRDRKPLQRQF